MRGMDKKLCGKILDLEHVLRFAFKEVEQVGLDCKYIILNYFRLPAYFTHQY